MYPKDYDLNYEDDRTAAFFSVPFEALNNWSAHRVKIWGGEFPTAEHAFQWKKFSASAPKIAEQIMLAPSPWAVYQVAKANKSHADPRWNEIKLDVMKQIISAKLSQNEDVHERLLATGYRQIMENSPWDSFWGVGRDKKGQNHLGKIWTDLRDKL